MQNSSCHKIRWINIKIIYFNATNNYHHLIKAEAHHSPVEEFALSLCSGWSTISKLSGMIACLIAAAAAFQHFQFISRSWWEPIPGGRHDRANIHLRLPCSGTWDAAATKPSAHKSWVGVSGCPGGLSRAAQAALPPLQLFLPAPAAHGHGTAVSALRGGRLGDKGWRWAGMMLRALDEGSGWCRGGSAAGVEMSRFIHPAQLL